MLEKDLEGGAHLLVVLDAHAEGVDQDGDHDAPVEVLALHDPLQLLPEAHEGSHHSVAVLGSPAPPAAPPPASQVPDLNAGGESLRRQVQVQGNVTVIRCL